MLVCAALWSTAGIFIKLTPWNPFAIAGFRSAIGAVVVLIYLKLSKTPFKFGKQSFINGALMSLTFLAFVIANKLTSAANAIVLQFTAPVFLMLYSSLLFKERFRKGDALAVLVTLAGIALFFFDQLEPGYILGNLIAILAGAFMGGMYLAVGKADEATKMGGMLLGHIFTAAVGIPFAFFTPTPLTMTPVLCVLALGVLQLGIPYILLVLSSKNCPPLACSLLGAVEPLLNPVWVFLFDGEAPGIFALAGGVIVIAAITVWCIWQNKNPQKAATPAQ